MTGLDLQDRLHARGCNLPIIVVTGHGDVANCTRAFKAGAFDFVEKPADGRLLLDRVREAFKLDQDRRRTHATHAEIAHRLGRLTARERDTLNLLVRGLSVKQLASELAIDHRTAAKHRARVHAKMEVNNDAELVRLMLGQESETR